MCLMCTCRVCSNLLCVSPFSSVNSECSDEVSDYSDDNDVDSTDDSAEEDDNSVEESDLEGMAPTTKRCKVARGKALSASLKLGKYPTFLGMHGPTQQVNPNDGSVLDYLLMLWPAALCQLIAVETNRYALQRGVSGWCDVTGTEVWTFLRVVILMGLNRLPRISNYWSTDCFIGIPNRHCHVTG